MKRKRKKKKQARPAQGSKPLLDLTQPRLRTLVHIRALAKELELSTRRIYQLQEKGVFQPLRRGRYDLEEAQRSYRRYLQEELRKRPEVTAEGDRRLVKIGQISKRLRLSPSRIRQLVDSGILPRADHGRYDEQEVIDAHLRYLQKRQGERSGKNGNEASPDLFTAKHRYLMARADREEFEVARRRETMIPLEVFGQELETIVLTMRQELLRLEQVAFELEGQPASMIRQILRRKINRILHKISRTGDGQRADKPEGMVSAATAEGD